MKIIDLYVIKKYLGTLIFMLALLSVIILVVDVQSKTPRIESNGFTVGYFLLNFYPYWILNLILTFMSILVFITVIFFTSRMANNTEIVADFAVNEQSYTIGGNIDSENATRFILKKYNIKGELFTESYKYYMTKPETIKDIFDKAQDIIQSKDPKAEEYISKKLKESGNVPAQAR